MYCNQVYCKYKKMMVRGGWHFCVLHSQMSMFPPRRSIATCTSLCLSIHCPRRRAHETALTLAHLLCHSFWCYPIGRVLIPPALRAPDDDIHLRQADHSARMVNRLGASMTIPRDVDLITLLASHTFSQHLAWKLERHCLPDGRKCLPGRHCTVEQQYPSEYADGEAEHKVKLVTPQATA